MFPIMKRRYTEAKERSPINGGQDVAVGFFFAFSLLFYYPLAPLAL